MIVFGVTEPWRKWELKCRSLGFKSHTLFMAVCWFLCRSCVCHWKMQMLPAFSEAAMIKSLIAVFMSWTHSDCLSHFGQVWASFCFSLAAKLSVSIFSSSALFPLSLNAIQMRKASFLPRIKYYDGDFSSEYLPIYQVREGRLEVDT